MTDLPNLALRRPASQSSRSMFSAGVTVADDAAGGNNGQINGGAGFHTGHDLPAWWMVDLQACCEIDRVCLYNRLGFGARLRHFSLLASDDGAYWRVLFQKVSDNEFGGADGHPFEHDFAPGISARYLRVQQNDPSLFLHFDEFQAFGRRPDAETSHPDAGPPVLQGRAALTFTASTDISNFGLVGAHEALDILASMLPPPQIPMRSNITPDPVILEEHFQYRLPPAVRAYAVAGAQLWGDGIVTQGGGFVFLGDCLPDYYSNWIKPDGHGFSLPLQEPERWMARERIASARPVACAIHPNMVYGHFLLEMLPRLFVAGLLRQCGAQFAIAVPSTAPGWMRRFVDLYVPIEDQIVYDPARHVIDAPSIILPSMMHEKHNFHPAFNLLVADLRGRVGLPPIPAAARGPTPRRIYLSRRRLEQNNRLLNQDEIETLMPRLGFTIVHPQELSIHDQLALFDGAEVVAGEYSSALHNTLFSRPGTRVISLDSYSWYQGAIGRLRQQPHGFVAPDDGTFRYWRLTTPERNYRIDPMALQAMVLEMAPEAAADLTAPVAEAPAALPPQIVAATPSPVLAAGAAPAPIAPEPVPNGAWTILLGQNLPSAPLAQRPSLLRRWFGR